MQLTANGHRFDTSPDRFGDLEPANHLLGDDVALREAMAEHGHLFFRGLLPADRVVEARHEILQKYAIVGLLSSYPDLLLTN